MVYGSKMHYAKHFASAYNIKKSSYGLTFVFMIFSTQEASQSKD